MNDKNLVRTLLAQLSDDQGVPTDQLVRELPGFMNPDFFPDSPNKPVRVNQAALNMPQPEVDAMLQSLSNKAGLDFDDRFNLQQLAPRVDPTVYPELAQRVGIPEEAAQSNLRPAEMARVLANEHSTGGLSPQQRHIMRMLINYGEDDGTDTSLERIRQDVRAAKGPQDFIWDGNGMIYNEDLANRGFSGIDDYANEFNDILRQLGVIGYDELPARWPEQPRGVYRH